MNSNEIRIIYGKDAESMTRKLVSSIPLESMIGDRDTGIVIKPNLVVPSKPEQGATTHTAIITALIEYLQENGFRNITVAEGSWVGSETEDAFRLNGYYRIRDRYGVKLVDTKKDRFRKLTYDGLTMEVSETMLSAGFLINLPVLKGHCQTLMTCCLKNMKGCLSDRSKRDFHRWGLMHPIAALNMLVKPSLHIIDSISGDLDFEEGGNPVETDRMMASTDPIALDAYASTLMGYTPEDIGYIREAIALGIAKSPEWEIEELSKPVSASAKPNGTVKQLSAHTAPVEACSACYASLIRALKILGDEGGLRKLGNRKIAIGQGYRNASPELGAGLCCRNAVKHAGGCPASAKDILEMLRSIQ